MQHIEQLDEIYGQHNARTIMNNSAAFMAFGSNEIHELEYLSRVVGEEMFDVQTVQMGVSQTKGGSKKHRYVIYRHELRIYLGRRN